MVEKTHHGRYSESEETPYTSAKRVLQPKETFKAALNLLRPALGDREKVSFLDLGCANGELIHYIASSYPSWQFTGIDITPAFIETANSLGIKNARFQIGDLFSASGKFDVVTCIGTLPLFEDIEGALERLIAVCALGGALVVDGFFNPCDMDVKIEFRQNLGEGGPWHVGFNHFSQARVAKYLKGRGYEFAFHPVPFNTDLPRNPSNPATYAWSFRDEDGKRHLTNGLGILVNTTMLVVRV